MLRKAETKTNRFVSESFGATTLTFYTEGKTCVVFVTKVTKHVFAQEYDPMNLTVVFCFVIILL